MVAWRDKSSLERFDEDDGVGTICRDILVDNGLVMRAVGDSIVTAPPLTMTRDHVDESFGRPQNMGDLNSPAWELSPSMTDDGMAPVSSWWDGLSVRTYRIASAQLP